MAKFATYDEMVAQAGASYKVKATGDALAAGLEPYAPPGQTVRGSVREGYDRKVSRVANNFKTLWGDIWRGRVFGPR
ncbi:MAG: hypothetical protein AAB270_08365 [Chloroflexota bacterium]